MAGWNLPHAVNCSRSHAQACAVFNFFLEGVTMLYVRRWGILLMVPALAYVLAATGCGSDKGKDVPRTGTGGSRPSAVSTARDSDSGSSNVEATALEAKGEATVKGKVTYDGTPPAPDDLTKQMELQGKDKAHCL